MSEPSYDALIDARGLNCPWPLVKARQALMVLPAGARIRVLATDPASRRDFEEFVEATGHGLEEAREEAGTFLFLLVKRGA